MPSITNLFVEPQVHMLEDTESPEDPDARRAELAVTGLLCHAI